MKALLIEVDFRTGKRAGDIDPRDPKLQCYGWQDVESKPGKEIRLITDNRDIKQYEGVPGITILDGPDEINAAINANVPVKYHVQDMSLLLTQFAEKGIKISEEYAGKTLDEIAKAAYDLHLAGVLEMKPEQVE